MISEENELSFPILQRDRLCENLRYNEQVDMVSAIIMPQTTVQPLNNKPASFIPAVGLAEEQRPQMNTDFHRRERKDLRPVYPS